MIYVGRQSGDCVNIDNEAPYVTYAHIIGPEQAKLTTASNFEQWWSESVVMSLKGSVSGTSFFKSYKAYAKASTGHDSRMSHQTFYEKVRQKILGTVATEGKTGGSVRFTGIVLDEPLD